VIAAAATRAYVHPSRTITLPTRGSQHPRGRYPAISPFSTYPFRELIIKGGEKCLIGHSAHFPDCRQAALRVGLPDSRGSAPAPEHPHQYRSNRGRKLCSWKHRDYRASDWMEQLRIRRTHVRTLCLRYTLCVCNLVSPRNCRWVKANNRGSSTGFKRGV
jgi:hypothetical protein